MTVKPICHAGMNSLCNTLMVLDQLKKNFFLSFVKNMLMFSQNLYKLFTLKAILSNKPSNRFFTFFIF